MVKAPSQEWAYVRVVDSETGVLKRPNTVGRPHEQGECVFCFKRYSAATNRIRAHVGGFKTVESGNIESCPGPSQLDTETEAEFHDRLRQFSSAKHDCKDAFRDAKERQYKKEQKRILEDRANGIPCNDNEPKRPRHSYRQTELQVTKTNKQEAADQALARAFYVAGLPPNILDNIFFKRALRKIALVGDIYEPLGRKPCSTGMLKAERIRVEDQLKTHRQIRQKYGYTLVSDGGSGVDRKPYLNILHNAPGFVEFVTQKLCQGRVKNAQFICDFITDHVNAMPAKERKQLVQILQDNATRSSWSLLTKALPWVVVGPCMTHVLDLMMEDICKAEWIREVILKASKLRKFIRNHQHVDAAFTDESHKQLTKPGATRFATVLLGLQNMKDCKTGVINAMNKQEVVEYVHRNRYQRSTSESPSLMDLYKESHAIASDLEFWEGADMVIASLTPGYKLLRLTDSTAPTASKVHYNMFRVQQCMKELQPGLAIYFGDEDKANEEVQRMVEIVCHRWDYGYTDIQGVGYLLDPEFWDMASMTDPEIRESFHAMILRTFPLPDGLDMDGKEDTLGLTIYDLQNFDNEDDVVAEARKVLENRSSAMSQLTKYKDKEGVFAIPMVQQHAREMSACAWWGTYGYECPQLREIAMRVLGQVSSSGSSERGHKAMNNTRSKSRNRLESERMDDLIYVQQNLLSIEKIQNGKASASEVVNWDLLDCLDDDELGWFCDNESEQEDNEDDCEDRNHMVAQGKKRAARVETEAESRIKPVNISPEKAAENENTAALLLKAAQQADPTLSTISRSGRAVVRPQILDI